MLHYIGWIIIKRLGRKKRESINIIKEIIELQRLKYLINSLWIFKIKRIKNFEVSLNLLNRIIRLRIYLQNSDYNIIVSVSIKLSTY